MRAAKTLYIVADGGRARYVEHVGPRHFATFRLITSEHLHDKGAALSDDRPGRVQESANVTRHAIAERIDPRDKVEAEFIRSLGENLSKDDTIAAYERLVLVAPAKLQRLLRASLSPALSAKLFKCLNKDLTKVPDGDLHQHLPEFFGLQATAGKSV